MKTNTICILIALNLVLFANAQKSAGYFGKRNFLSLEKGIKLPVLGKIKYERQVSRNILIGFGIGMANYRNYYFDDADRGYENDPTYSFKSNGITKHTNHSYGGLSLKYTDFQFSIKKFSNLRSVTPLGRFWSICAGNLSVSYKPKGDFVFTEYNFNTQKVSTYKAEEERRQYPIPYLSFELGKSVPFFQSNRFIFSYSARFNLLMNLYSPESGNSAKHFAYVTARELAKTNTLNINFCLSYAL